MAKKATKKAKTGTEKTGTQRDRILDAALRLAAQHPWNDISLRDIAKQSKLPLTALRREFDDHVSILAGYSKRVDEQVMSDASGSGATRDRLFDVLMARFDILNNDRAAVISIIDGLKTNPKHAALFFPHLVRSMLWMCEAAGMDTGGTTGALKAGGLAILYLKTLCAWRDDDSRDLSKTMAALDKNLGYGEQFLSTFGLNNGEK